MVFTVRVENTLPICLGFILQVRGPVSLPLFPFFLGMGHQRCPSHGGGSSRGCSGLILQPPGEEDSPHPASCRTSCCSLPGIYSQVLDSQMLLLAPRGLGVHPLGRTKEELEEEGMDLFPARSRFLNAHPCPGQFQPFHTSLLFPCFHPKADTRDTREPGQGIIAPPRHFHACFQPVRLPAFAENKFPSQAELG